jgi:uncharacterized membrane protein (UPF0127 family)
MSSFIFIQNQNRPIPHPARIQMCDSFACRLRGLMFRAELSSQAGLLLALGHDSRADSSIHMFFVPFDLAVFWINSAMTVVDKVLAKSWRPAYFASSAARYTLELHPDRWADYEIGEQVRFHNA